MALPRSHSRMRQYVGSNLGARRFSALARTASSRQCSVMAAMEGKADGRQTAAGTVEDAAAHSGTDGGEARVVAPQSRLRIDPGGHAPRVCVSPPVPRHASLVLRRGWHVVHVLADLLIAGVGGRPQVVVLGHRRPAIDIGLGAENTGQEKGRSKNCAFHLSLHRKFKTGLYWPQAIFAWFTDARLQIGWVSRDPSRSSGQRDRAERAMTPAAVCCGVAKRQPSGGEPDGRLSRPVAGP
jgi:hypothetical protein